MNDMTKTGANRRTKAGPAGRSYRAYTDDNRAHAMVAYYANGGNLRRTAAQVGIPVTTLRKWAKDGVKPADPRRVLTVGATLDAKLEAWIDQALAIDPASFPMTSFLEHVQAICLLVDMVVKLREGCQPVAAQLAAAARPENKPIDLTKASPADLAALRAWIDRLTAAAPPADRGHPPEGSATHR